MTAVRHRPTKRTGRIASLRAGFRVEAQTFGGHRLDHLEPHALCLLGSDDLKHRIALVFLTQPGLPHQRHFGLTGRVFAGDRAGPEIGDRLEIIGRNGFTFPLEKRFGRGGGGIFKRRVGNQGIQIANLCLDLVQHPFPPITHFRRQPGPRAVFGGALGWWGPVCRISGDRRACTVR